MPWLNDFSAGVDDPLESFTKTTRNAVLIRDKPVVRNPLLKNMLQNENIIEAKPCKKTTLN